MQNAYPIGINRCGVSGCAEAQLLNKTGVLVNAATYTVIDDIGFVEAAMTQGYARYRMDPNMKAHVVDAGVQAIEESILFADAYSKDGL